MKTGPGPELHTVSAPIEPRVSIFQNEFFDRVIFKSSASSICPDKIFFVLHKIEFKKQMIYALSICPDKIFFVQDNIQIVQDKNFVQG